MLRDKSVTDLIDQAKKIPADTVIFICRNECEFDNNKIQGRNCPVCGEILEWYLG